MSAPEEVWALLLGNTDRVLMELTNDAERAHKWLISWNRDLVVRYVPETQLLAAQVREQRLRGALSHICGINTDDVEGNYPEEERDAMYQIAGEALVTQPDLYLLEAHDAKVKREGAREALTTAADRFNRLWKTLSGQTVAQELCRMIAALDQPTDQPTDQQKEG